MMRIPNNSIYPVITSGAVKPTTTTGSASPNRNQKEPLPITVEIPREANYNLPEGRYRAKISGLKPSTKPSARGPQPWIKILFDVQVPGLSERFDTRAGRQFKLNLQPGSELKTWLTDLFGKEFFSKCSGKQIDLNSLLNTECEVVLTHWYGVGYKKPLVIVDSIHPVEVAGGND